MNLTSLLIGSYSIKKQLYIVLTVLLVILSLPTMAVLALGQNALKFLSHSQVSSSPTQGAYQGPLVAGDNYAWGNCTWWVYKLRLEAGDPIPNTWGNAATWTFYASLAGYQVNHTPTAGSIMQISTFASGLGHVAYVTQVNQKNGTWTISEMNAKGLDIVDTQTFSASYAKNFNFIHDKNNSQPLQLVTGSLNN